MDSRSGGADVAVIGCGVVGLACAWRAAAAGMHVVAVDPAPMSGASHVAAGMLAPVAEATFHETHLLGLALESWRRYPSFIEELEAESGTVTGYDTTGTLLVARDSDDTAALERELRHRQSLGLDVERLSATECRRLEPALAPSVRGGIRAAGDHQVDPRRLASALRNACERAGVTFVTQRAALRVTLDRVTGVRLQDGAHVEAQRVVLAAGCWSAQVDGVPASVAEAVRPVKGQVLRLRPRTAALTRHVVRGLDVYAVPRDDGSLVVGATVEERGYDTSVSARAMYELLRDARELLPDVLEMDLAEASAGLRPGTPDNAPSLGRCDVAGLVVATGHHRNGILLTPVTADIVVALLADAAPPVDIAPFAPQRCVRVAVPA